MMSKYLPIIQCDKAAELFRMCPERHKYVAMFKGTLLVDLLLLADNFSKVKLTRTSLKILPYIPKSGNAFILKQRGCNRKSDSRSIG